MEQKKSRDKFNETILSDKKGNRENPWQPKKVRSLKLADSLARQGEDKRSIRVRFCGSQLAFLANTETGVKKLHSANFCRDRLCPMCSWRKSLKCFSEVSRVMNVSQAENPKLVPIFLTLTLRNCTGDELGRILDFIFQGWHRLTNNDRMKRIIKGWFRALEVTYNKKDDSFHPHIHAILMVDRGYFKGEDYIQTTEWVKLWRKSLRLDYDPICDIRKVKGGKKAIKEVSKYTVKDVDYISDDKELTDRLVSVFSSALRNRRLYAYGGKLKEVAKRLGALNPDEGDLIHIDEDGQLRDDVEWVLVVYRWSMGLANYYAEAVLPAP